MMILAKILSFLASLAIVAIVAMSVSCATYVIASLIWPDEVIGSHPFVLGLKLGWAVGAILMSLILSIIDRRDRRRDAVT